MDERMVRLLPAPVVPTSSRAYRHVFSARARRRARLQPLVDRYRDQPFLLGRLMQLQGAALLGGPVPGLPDRRPTGFFYVVLLLLFGLCWTGLGIAGLHAQGPKEGTVVKRGQVVSVYEQRGEYEAARAGEKFLCTPTVRYFVGDSVHEVQAPHASTTMCDWEGRFVPVSYYPDAPGEGRILLPRSELKLLYAFALGGLLLVLWAWFEGFQYRRSCSRARRMLEDGGRMVRASPRMEDERLVKEFLERWPAPGKS